MLRELYIIMDIKYVEANGKYGVFKGNPRDLSVFGEYLRTGMYSPTIVHFLCNWFNEHGPGTFIDIGANIGLTTVPVARAGVKCLSFEPEPNNFAALRTNASEFEDAGRVELFNVALFDSDDELTFEMSDWNYGDHRVRRAGGELKGAFGEQHRKVITVQAGRLDEIVDTKSLQRPIAAKIDAQGAEVHILNGGKEVLSSVDLMLLEFCPYLIRRMGADEVELIDFIEEHFSYGFIVCHSNFSYRSDDISYSRFAPIDEICNRLRSFSRSVKTPAHLDLVILKNASREPADVQN